MVYKAYFYLRQNGRCPLEEYIEDLPSEREIAYIEAFIDKLIQSEGKLPPPHAKKVSGKIWELRPPLGNRIFYFTTAGQEIILLDGFTKKRDRIPPKVLKKIQGEYEDYRTYHNRKLYK
jgi:phage-related protein